MNKKWSYYLLAAVIVNTLFRYHPFCFQFGSPEENHTSFSVAQALSFILVVMAMKLKLNSATEKIIWEIGLWVMVSNLLDEMFFNPLVLGWNEIFFAITITIRTFWLHLWKIRRLEKRL